jgi:hypothetical protein
MAQGILKVWFKQQNCLFVQKLLLKYNIHMGGIPFVITIFLLFFIFWQYLDLNLEP